MKRIVALILAAVMVFSITACGGEKTYTADDLAIRDIESGKIIRIGDTREEVEKIIGEPTDEEEYDKDNENRFVSCSYRDGNDLILSIRYDKDDKIRNISLYGAEKEEAKYELLPGVQTGSSYKDFLKAYPGSKEVFTSRVSLGPGRKSVGVLLKKNGDHYEICGEEESQEANVFSNNYAYIVAVYDETSYIWSIDIENRPYQF